MSSKLIPVPPTINASVDFKISKTFQTFTQSFAIISFLFPSHSAHSLPPSPPILLLFLSTVYVSQAGLEPAPASDPQVLSAQLSVLLSRTGRPTGGQERGC